MTDTKTTLGTLTEISHELKAVGLFDLSDMRVISRFLALSESWIGAKAIGERRAKRTAAQLARTARDRATRAEKRAAAQREDDEAAARRERVTTGWPAFEAGLTPKG